ncbi:high affinity immunoglobulin gamma Fc receptor I-like [Lithobates pipiens]
MSPLVLHVLFCNCVAGAIYRPFVTFIPNWNKVFKYEQITVQCNVRSSAPINGQYTWYKDGRQLNTRQWSINIGSAQIHHSGRYQCQIVGSEPSDPVSLHVSDDGVILQAATPIYEGEMLHLRCRSLSGYGYVVKRITFYKDGKVVQTSDKNSDFYLSRVTVDATGTYKCEKNIFFSYDRTHSDENFIVVKELFSPPKLRLPSYPLIEGDHVTLTCDTSVGPLTPRTELHFAFYKDGRNVQKSSLSNQYGVRSLKLEDSGKYSCEARTLNYNVAKKSGEIYLLTQRLLPTPQINLTSSPVIEGDNMTLICSSSVSPPKHMTELWFAFYRDDQIVQNFSKSDQYGVQSSLGDSGNYYCEVKAPTSNLKKRSGMLTIAVQKRSSIKKQAQDDYNLQNIIRLVLSGLIIIAIAVILYDNVKKN